MSERGRHRVVLNGGNGEVVEVAATGSAGGVPPQSKRSPNISPETNGNSGALCQAHACDSMALWCVARVFVACSQGGAQSRLGGCETPTSAAPWRHPPDALSTWMAPRRTPWVASVNFSRPSAARIQNRKLPTQGRETEPRKARMPTAAGPAGD
eukprot:CAMPEP_0174323152 /NCGR_PEP_ID=MMETSP0810-20121108/11581_1 /TAXON_ID=73025 ORGANISM="Eutreptiella gymnastica-like, Strain CCMP1594" /NCGR_SAMPLE_ID=MMETSP0810 /ASSEMBLY_ACC=CAM_ASM_000659 /LENGTH=153 /DNA_ID=CAMNT_0015435413 /DNA_START=30 /DNA_END=490 /DNA_ORIENTATION=+